MKRDFRIALAFCFISLLVSLVGAKIGRPRPLEEQLASPETIVIGRVIEISTRNDLEGENWSTATLEVKEVLKGEIKEKIIYINFLERPLLQSSPPLPEFPINVKEDIILPIRKEKKESKYFYWTPSWHPLEFQWSYATEEKVQLFKSVLPLAELISQCHRNNIILKDPEIIKMFPPLRDSQDDLEGISVIEVRSSTDINKNNYGDVKHAYLLLKTKISKNNIDFFFNLKAFLKQRRFESRINLFEIKKAVGLFLNRFSVLESRDEATLSKVEIYQGFGGKAHQFVCYFDFEGKAFSYSTDSTIRIDTRNESVSKYYWDICNSRLEACKEFIEKLENDEMSVFSLKARKPGTIRIYDFAEGLLSVGGRYCRIDYDVKKKNLHYYFNSYLGDIVKFADAVGFQEIKTILGNKKVKQFIESIPRSPHTVKIYASGSSGLGWNIILENTRSGEKMEAFVRKKRVKILKGTSKKK